MIGRLALGGAPLAVLLLALSGCSDDGAAIVRDSPAFVSCVQDAGASIDGSEDWEQPQWADFFAQPQPLSCAIDDLDSDARQAALQEAFPRYWEQDDAEASYEQRMDALVGQASAKADEEGERAALRDGQTLVESLEWQEAPDADGAVLTLVVAVLDELGELPDFAAFSRDNSFGSENDARNAYGTSLNTATGPLGDRFRDLYTTAIDGFDADDLVP